MSEFRSEPRIPGRKRGGLGGSGQGCRFSLEVAGSGGIPAKPSASRNPGACAEEQLPVGLAGQAGLVPGHGGGAACITATWRELAWIRSWGGAQVFLILTRYLLLKVWALCQQHRQHLGAC